MTLPMLADFSVRLSAGMAGLLLVASWRQIPPAFFRTHCVVILGLLVLASMVEGWSSTGPLATGITIAGAVLAYLGSILWGLGLPRVANPATALLTALCATLLAWASWGPSPGLSALNAAGTLASAFLLGSTMTAMLLGHHYLTAPAMSIKPLKRFVACMALALALRSALAAAGLGLLASGRLAPPSLESPPALFLAMRWGMGGAGFALATFLAWRTVQIRSTQSATGILYIAMLFALVGELSAMILSRSAGIVL
jgi:hypothetical protein